MDSASPRARAAADTVNIAATAQLARSLREDYALRRQQAGRRVWTTPCIVSLDQWVADVWAASWPPEQLISSTQALSLWLEAIVADSQDRILAPLAAAREALRAEQKLLTWHLDATRLPARTDEQRAWLGWRRKVRARMQDHHWVLREDLIGIVAAAVHDGYLTPPACILLHGFTTEVTPAVRSLLEALRERCTVEDAPTGHVVNPPRTCCMRPADPGDEMRFVAATIRDRLSAVGTDGLAPRISVVFTDTGEQRDMLESALQEFLVPSGGRVSPRKPWRWEDARAASAWPMIEAAIAVFNLSASAMDTAHLSRFLLAAPLWPDPLREAAAALDYQLRRTGRPRYRLADATTMADTTLKARLGKLRDVLREEPRHALPSAWAEAMEARLAALDWPADTVLGSVPYQCLRELRRRLARLATMDTMLGRIDRSNAQLWLSELLRAGFQPRVEYAQPVSMLAPENAANLPCELLIVCDATTASFPGWPAPTPFLALEAQRAAGIPDSAPTTHLDHCRHTVAAMCSQAEEVLVLCPAIDATGAETQPSPLFGAVWSPAPTWLPTSHREKLAVAPTPATLPSSDAVPPVAATEAVHGDSGLFTQWAESPFFAFCSYRLGIEAFPIPARGLDARVQGIILHDALHRFWERVQTQNQLDVLIQAGRQTFEAAVAAALEPSLKRALPRRDYGHSLVDLEAVRLRDLLQQWLHHETRRVDRFAVTACELRMRATLAGLPLSLVIDRIDRVDTQRGPRWLVLDYKTGRDASPRGWEADRLRAPQLPLYAILAPAAEVELQQVDGIGFAHLKDGHPALSVAANWCHKLLDTDSEPKRDWNTRLHAWTEVLEAAARGFLAGEADFDASTLPNDAHNTWLLPLTGSIDDEDAVVPSEPES